MSVAAEERRIKKALERVEALEEVAGTFDESDGRKATLHRIIWALLTDIGPVRPSIAAHLLQLSEPTVRTWTREGVLITAEQAAKPSLLDPHRVHEVMHLIHRLRAAGRERNLLEAVWHRLSDRSVLEREDLQESLEQMRNGEGRPLTSGELERRALP
ncbi:hypothetical protein [Phytohabitans aurantiacus]|uniref:Transcriptional regulator n=1 Tax=Phytohabitans aurantiacus TaxID=3016789 RepID=A0ABQ5RA59_9ACTN|nr:hypothetical protein [Phytohabitans aurantiacus]GLI03283.1 hypothetical protein Pa4123_85610 [Phytohabitans aurantiacus]